MGAQSGLIARPLAVIMNRRLRTLPVEATLAQAAKMMRDERTGAVLITENGQFVGIVSETDLVRKAMAEQLDTASESVRRIMSCPIITIEIDRTAHDASDLMAEKGIRHLVVTRDDRIEGLLSVRDLLRYFKNWGA
ncbi:hypothetical protein YTPLAS18_35030 [Nitrospira sp.]|nr:hypothetical protein YTPLAS18_35030 [Nitrospira sp.]